jgi:hypothetical protein
VIDRPIRLVLDTSAILAFAGESLHVGETISQVDENGAAFGLPIVCLAAAHKADGRMLQMLTSHQACELLTVEVDEWRQWAAMTDVLGRLDVAAALLAASSVDCDVLTGEPDLYGVLGDDPPIIGI